MIRDKSVFVSKKHNKYHNMLKNGFDGILSEVNLTEDQILNNVKCHINLAHKNRKKLEFFEIDSVEKLMKFENYKSYNFLLEKNLLVVKEFPLYRKKINFSLVWENYSHKEKSCFLKSESVHEYIIKDKKNNCLPKLLNLYLKNKENKLHLSEFMNYYFSIYEGDAQKSRDLLNMFNDNYYQNIKNKDFVFFYLHKTIKDEDELLATKSLMFYPNTILIVNPHNNGPTTITNHVRSEEEIFTIEGKIKYSLLNFEKRLSCMHKYIEDSQFEIIDAIEGFKDFFEIIPFSKKDLYLKTEETFKTLYEKNEIENTFNSNTEKSIQKIRL